VEVDGKPAINHGEIKIEVQTERTGYMRYNYYITGIKNFKLNDLSVTGTDINESTNVSITITVETANGKASVTYSETIEDLKLQKQ
jgi:hypothetical protein